MHNNDKKSNTWYVYILECSDNTFYTGITVDLERRLSEHNDDNKLGSRYTRSRRPVSLVYSESCSDRSAASRREAAIRKMSRRLKLCLIEGYSNDERGTS